MGLASSITVLAVRIDFKVRTKIDATHSGLARVWVSFDCVGGQIAIDSAYSVASVVRIAASRYCVYSVLAMSDANYCWTALARNNNSSGQQRVAIAHASLDLKTAWYVSISCATTATSFDDSSEVDLVVYR